MSEMAIEPTTTTVESAAVVDGCAVCPARSVAEDSSYGYCEGCTGRLRLCRSCGEYRAQADWGWGHFGLVFVQLAWVCSDCRWRTLDRVGELPTFVATMPAAEDARALAAELDRAARRESQYHPAVAVLHAMATALLEGGDGALVVDVHELDLDMRRALSVVLAGLAESAPRFAYQAAYSLHRAWMGFVEDSAAPRVEAEPAPTVAERVGLLGLERPVGDGGAGRGE